eukprot:3212015-Prymnesium_polylepis.2
MAPVISALTRPIVNSLSSVLRRMASRRENAFGGRCSSSGDIIRCSSSGDCSPSPLGPATTLADPSFPIEFGTVLLMGLSAPWNCTFAAGIGFVSCVSACGGIPNWEDGSRRELDQPQPNSSSEHATEDRISAVNATEDFLSAAEDFLITLTRLAPIALTRLAALRVKPVLPVMCATPMECAE